MCTTYSNVFVFPQNQVAVGWKMNSKWTTSSTKLC